MEGSVNWTASWIWTQDEARPKNYYFYARGAFQYHISPVGTEKKRILLYITADNRYKLYFNGIYLGRGPVRSDPRWQYYDTYDITGLAAEGKNVVAVLIHYYGVPNALAINGRGGLLCQVEETDDKTASILLTSGSSWKVKKAMAWKQEVPQVHPRQDFIEVFDSRKEAADWNYSGFDDSSWQKASVIGMDGPQSTGWIPQDPSYVPSCCVRPWETLVPRDIPFLHEGIMYPEKISDKGEIFETKKQPGRLLDPAVQIACDITMELQDTKVVNVENLMQKPDEEPVIIEGWMETSSVGSKFPCRDINIKTPYIVLDFGKQVNGYFHIKMEGIDGGIVDIGYSESLINNRVYPLFDGNRGDRYIMKDGIQDWETFMWKSFRYVQLSFRSIQQPVKLHEANIRFSTYPVEYKGEFKCSDDVLTKIWETARYTCQLCMMDAYMDNPSNELRQYIQTGRILALVSYAAFGDYKLAGKMLRQISQSRKSDGCVHVAWPDGHAADRLSVDFVDGPILFIQAVWEYFLYSGDKQILQDLYPCLVDQMSWFSRFLDKEGFISDIPSPIWIDHADLDRHGKSAILNAWFYCNLLTMKSISQELQDGERAEKYSQMAQHIKKDYHARYWDDEKGLYADSCYGAHKSCKVSEHTNAIAYLYGLGETSCLETVLKTLYSGEKDAIMGSPLFQLFIINAWCRMNKGDFAITLLKNRFEGLIKEGASTFGTMWSRKGPHVFCQSEASSPVYLLTSHVLGIQPKKAGFEEFYVYPSLGGLDWARGTFPSLKGDIRVEWEKSPAGLNMQIVIPDRTVCYVGIPCNENIYTEISLNGRVVWDKGLYIDKAYEPEEAVLEKDRVILKISSGSVKLTAASFKKKDI